MDFGLVELLTAAWVTAILPVVVASLPCSSLRWFHELVLGFAKRGKILPSSHHHKLTVPQRFFSHFYVVAVAWTSILLLTTWIYAYRTAPLNSEPLFYSNIANYLAGGSNIFSFHRPQLIPLQRRSRVWLSVLLLLLMELQVLRRLFETMFVFKYSPSARMHIFGYLTGLFFYTAVPLSLCCTCAPEVLTFCKNELTALIIGEKSSLLTVELDWWDFVNPLLKLGWCSWVGAAIFLWGWIHQLRCHAILGSLRGGGENLDEYVIPHGDWFEIVSSPHYLAEIVIYAGMVFASGGADLTIWLLFSFVVANLVIAAAETHSLMTFLTLNAIPYGVGAAARFSPTKFAFWMHVVSNELGAGNSRAARIAFHGVMLIAIAEAIVVSTTLFACRRVFGYVFSNEKKVVDYVTTMSPLVCLSVIMDSLQGVLSGVARGCAWQHTGAYINLGAFYICGIPVAAVLGFWLQLRGMGLWIGILASAFTQTVLLAIIASCTNCEKQAIKAEERIFGERVSANNGLI